MLDGGEAAIHGRKLRLLQLDKRFHLLAGVAVSQMEHRVVQAVESGQRDELEFVTHGAEFALEASNRGVVEVLFPIERWRAVVRQHLAGELLVNRFGELTRELEVGLAGLAPDQIGVGAVGQSARNRLIAAGANAIEALDGALARAE